MSMIDSMVPVASFFVLWWVVLIAMLPWALGARGEEEEVRLGTMPGAPHRRLRLLRAILFTTVISVGLMVCYYVITDLYGFSFDDLPQVIPDFTESGRQTAPDRLD